MEPSTSRSILATDCGSTTTKAILIERRDDSYRLIVRGEAPTTVEAPFEDVTRGGADWLPGSGRRLRLDVPRADYSRIVADLDARRKHHGL